MSQKMESFQFHSGPQAELSPRFLYYRPGRRELPIPRKQCFLKIFFPEEEGGEDYGAEKNTKINKGIGHKFW